MFHLVVFLNLGILAIGLGLVVALAGDLRARPTDAGLWQLAHFASFTFTMAVAALDAYSIVNIGLKPFVTRLYSALVLAGCAAMLFSFVRWNLSRAGRPASRWILLFWAAAAAIPLISGAAILLIDSLGYVLFLIALSFVPFFGSVLYGLSLMRGAPAAKPRENALSFVGLGVLASAEVWWILRHPQAESHFFVTLPVAYLYVCWNVVRGRKEARAEPGEESDIPESLAAEKGLTERERDMARGILAGKSNKELAFELGISENTARNHIYNLYRKLGIQKRLDLVLLVRKYRSP